MTQRGKNNPNYRHGRYAFGNFCFNCGKEIDGRSKRCYKCRSLYDNPRLGRPHSKETKELIGEKSKKKFTKEYLQKMKRKHQGNKKRAINGYILIKDYKHPNRNSHNDVLEHIKIMSEEIGRKIRKGEIVHHKNFIRDDNGKRNLYLYPNRSSHLKASRSIFELVDQLLKNKIIKFKKGRYEMNKRRNFMAVWGTQS